MDSAKSGDSFKESILGHENVCVNVCVKLRKIKVGKLDDVLDQILINKEQLQDLSPYQETS
jgi:hypothetical protein